MKKHFFEDFFEISLIRASAKKENRIKLTEKKVRLKWKLRL